MNCIDLSGLTDSTMFHGCVRTPLSPWNCQSVQLRPLNSILADGQQQLVAIARRHQADAASGQRRAECVLERLCASVPRRDSPAGHTYLLSLSLSLSLSTTSQDVKRRGELSQDLAVRALTDFARAAAVDADKKRMQAVVRDVAGPKGKVGGFALV